ncbi:hypothetical protein Cni_G09265 [Canna indica]|uniref:Uncharacterized protein n=1 Tax=Canna indica TaxID=4628 RepID=A0AAQ3K2B4_9LILI|nr:hypothetical protein Cni_G09265 [Canna indica]
MLQVVGLDRSLAQRIIRTIRTIPETNHDSSSIEHGDDLDHTSTGESSSRKEVESIRLHMTELEEMVEKMTREKVEMETTLAVTSNQLKSACDQLVAAKGVGKYMQALKRKKEELDCQLESAKLELHKLQEKVRSFDRKLEEEKKFSTELLAKCQSMEVIRTTCD